MNFTREPIIESIVSPRDGFKLLVRNSKSNAIEEYTVDALEIVSFGHAFFLRSLEKPKSFLLPASDYEVVEVKETRMALKTINHEKNIKIGGGREASIRGNNPPAPEKEVVSVVVEEEETLQESVSSPAEVRTDGRRDRRRHRRRRGGRDESWNKPTETPSKEAAPASQGGDAPIDETPKVSSSGFTGLFPPPPLISETISRYKGQEFFAKDSEKKNSNPAVESQGEPEPEHASMPQGES